MVFRSSFPLSRINERHGATDLDIHGSIGHEPQPASRPVGKTPPDRDR